MVKGAGFNATIPGFWVMGALLAWAIHWRWVGGLAAAVVLSVADLAVRQDVEQVNYGNVFLLLLGGPIVGFMVESLQRMAASGTAPSARRPPRPSAPGWPGPCTTACSRCSRWCSAGRRARGRRGRARPAGG